MRPCSHLATIASLAFALAACSASPVQGDPSTGGSGGSGATGGEGGAGATGTTTTTTSTGNGGEGGGINPTTGAGGGEVCNATAFETEPIPLDAIVVLDRSGSMSGTRWTQSINALTQFFQSPASTGVNAALSFFPPLSGQECMATSYNPPQVPLSALPTEASVLVDAMSATSPTGLTPMYGAMLGSLQVATARQDQNPDHAVIVILASDGDPNSCSPSGIGPIASLAQSAYNYNGVRTFAIAIQGATVANLNQISLAGGGGQAIDITSDTTLFLQAMETIRAQVLGCEYAIPAEGKGDEFDPTKVNVTYKPGGVDPGESIPKVEEATKCGNGPGWYYDDPKDPSKVLLCQGSCKLLKADPDGKVEILFGCPSVVPD